jgi:hypothetical protein
MPVDIDVIEGEPDDPTDDPTDDVIVDDCITQTIPTIVIASIRYGNVIGGIELQVVNKTKQMEYPEFMYLNYSMLGDFIYDDCRFRLEIFVLNNQELTPTQQSAFLLENRTAIVVSSISAKQLDRIVNGAFTAIIEITIWSSAIQMGLKVNYMIDVTSAPTKPDIIGCDEHSHIYQIIDDIDFVQTDVVQTDLDDTTNE